ncbi:MAG TPA: RND transporter [SAR324 cluster bacterium]|nr:RND transporter [SAR324 cluster bacterium]MDP6248741.1 RND transporter [SAR324 cluster bacterium]MDP6331201.1 RND transporter [SAR324 cluster bacterium]MDP7333809.1 RND transporter [SAR324 cluster bacterium]MDP7500275.1 RND transporter [SAR324 cluster bacterium]
MFKIIFEFLDHLPWSVLIIICLSLGLAPFFPPHLFEKIKMLSEGQLVRPIDWFDLMMHATPWVLLILKFVLTLFPQE